MPLALSLLALLALAASPRAPRPEPHPAAEALQQEALPVGSASVEVDLDGTKLEVFTHKPEGRRGERMLFVFHGVLRNADEYRDHAVVLAERYSMLVIAPHFDKERFPSSKYQRGGILHEDGTAAKPQEWTYALVPKLARAIRERESKPGTALFPTRVQDFDYGFGKLPADPTSIREDERPAAQGDASRRRRLPWPTSEGRSKAPRAQGCRHNSPVEQMDVHLRTSRPPSCTPTAAHERCLAQYRDLLT